jgi:hypothetical protein
MQKVYQRHGYEAWAKWDDTAKVYDLFNDAVCDDGTVWIGYADTIEEARKIGEQYVYERFLNTFQVTSWNES